MNRRPSPGAVPGASPSAIPLASRPAPLSEHQLQRQVAAFLDRALPPDAFWTSIDSAGRGPIQGARMKARGVRKGLLDALVLYQHETIWLELKSARGKVTPEQRDFMNRAIMAGHACYVVRDLRGVELHLRAHQIPLRASVA